MILPYPNDPASLSQPNPLFNDNAFVRGDQFRLNNQRAWDNFDFLAAFLNQAIFGFVRGRLSVLNASPTIVRVPAYNAYDVSSIMLMANTEKTLDFSGLTNIFRTDGVTQITNVSETQNKQLYLLLTSTGTLQAMIIPNTDIANHNYGTNPKLLDAYYTGSPAIWDAAKNGYYRNSKRIIATLRLDTSNEIEFFYELDAGQRFQDVSNIAVGNLYTEARWKRCHPNCYTLDGSTIASMSTESPLLYRLLGGSNVLPDFNNRFARNIDLAGGRSMYGTQEDAFQAFQVGAKADLTGARDYWLAAMVRDYTVNAAANPQPNETFTQFLRSGQGAANGAVPMDDGTNGEPRTGIETRPKNFATSIQIVRG